MTQQSLDELEAEIKALEERAKAAKGKKAAKTTKPKTPKPAGQPTARAREQAAKAAARVAAPVSDSQVFKTSHGGFAGKSLVEKIQDQLDRMYGKYLRTLEADDTSDPRYDANLLMYQHRAEGMAAALGILRSTKMSIELELSKKRIDNE